MKVQCLQWRLSESKEHGGMAIFELAFVEAGAALSPSVVRAPAAGMRAACSSALSVSVRNFRARFSLHRKSDFLRSEAAAVLKQLGNLYLDVSRMAGVTNPVSALVYGLDDAAYDKLAGMLPESMAERIVALPKAIAGAFETPWSKYRNIDGTYRAVSTMRGGPLNEAVVTSLLKTMTFALDTPKVQYATATRRQQLVNQEAIGELSRQAALFEAARVAPFVNWRTLESAEDARERIAGALDVEMELTGDDDLYRALSTVRMTVVKSVPPDGTQLPFLVDHHVGKTTPALCLSYELYGTLDRADEIVELNRILHSGFVPGMEKLRVLANV